MIVVPQLAQQRILKTLHCPNSGSTKTYATARQLYYWPDMKKEIEEYINNCQICQAERPSQARPTCEFTKYGWPNVIGTDGGLQFRSEFHFFLQNIQLLTRAGKRAQENLPEPIAAWRNMARSDGKSPSQIFFGRRQRHALALTLDLMKPDTADNKNREQRYKDEIRFRNKYTKDSPPIRNWTAGDDSAPLIRKRSLK